MTLEVRPLGSILLTALVGLLAHPTLCKAQDERANPLRGGLWAIQFRINDNFQLSTFKGSIISVKRHYSPRSALRAGLSLTLSSVSVENESSFPDTTITTTGEADANSFRIELQYLGYTSPSRKLSPYWGVGPLVGYSRSSVSGSSPGSIDREVRGWTLGLIGTLGAEWFVTDFLGVHAEYGLSGTYSSRTDEARDPTDTRTKNESKDWRLGGESVLFGLSVYF